MRPSIQIGPVEKLGGCPGDGCIGGRCIPKIGIRPTIDGRLGGVRESLEERTMQQAKAVAELFAPELRYPTARPSSA
jgi:hypothetical protein